MKKNYLFLLRRLQNNFAYFFVSNNFTSNARLKGVKRKTNITNDRIAE